MLQVQLSSRQKDRQIKQKMKLFSFWLALRKRTISSPPAGLGGGSAIPDAGKQRNPSNPTPSAM
jgi:hypothetical protein